MEIQVRAYTQADLPALIRIWNEVVEDGVAFPQEELLDASSGAPSAAVSDDSVPDASSQPPAESQTTSEPAVSDSPDESGDESSVQPPDESTDTSGQIEMEHGWVINNLGYTYLYYDRAWSSSPLPPVCARAISARSIS